MLYFEQAEQAINQGDIEQAFQALIEAKELLDKHNQLAQTFHYYYLSGQAFSELSLLNQAMGSYLSAYEIALNSDLDAQINAVLLAMASTFTALKRFQEAGYYLDILLERAKAKDSSSLKHQVANQLARLSLAQNQNNQAIKQAQQALSLINDKGIESATSFYILGLAYLANENFEQAENHLKNALALHNKFQVKSGVLKDQLALAKINMAKERFNQAESSLEEIIGLAKQENFINLLTDALLLKKDLFTQLNQHEKALLALEEYTSTKLKIEARRAKAGLSHYIAQAELASKEVDIANLTKEKALAEQKNKATTRQAQLVIGASTIIVLLSIMFISVNKRKNQKLVSTLTELNKTQKALISADNMSAMTTLVSGMSHQLNTPLGVIITANSILKEKLVEIESKLNTRTLQLKDFISFIEDAQETIALTEKNSEKASLLIKQFKMISSHLEETEQIQVELQQFLHSKMKLLQSTQKDKFIFTVIGEAVEITSYPDVLFKVIEQLVENSSMHGNKADSPINISITTKVSNDMVELTYQDDGIGIANEKIDKVFNPFFTTNTMQKSLGLGMSIVHQSINNLLQGSIYCQPCDQGAKFTIKLPKTLAKVEAD
ncbi:ATP-binding protein [Thalassotalea ganghwensis]